MWNKYVRFYLFLLQYIIAPEKSVPVTWTGLVSVVLSEGKMHCCYVVNG